MIIHGFSCEHTAGASFDIGSVSVRQMEISEAQWEMAGELFESKLNKDCGMTEEKYELVTELLSNWDEMSVAERRERSGGNHVYWRKKYQVVGGMLCYVSTDDASQAEAEDVLSVKQVSHQGSMFDDIKMIHCASKRVPIIFTSAH